MDTSEYLKMFLAEARGHGDVLGGASRIAARAADSCGSIGRSVRLWPDTWTVTVRAGGDPGQILFELGAVRAREVAA